MQWALNSLLILGLSGLSVVSLFANQIVDLTVADNHIVVLPIGKQEVMIGGRIHICFTAFDVLSSVDETQSIHRPYLELTIGLKPDATRDVTTEFFDLSVSPNPIGRQGQLQINIPAKLQQEETVLRIYDFIGRKVCERTNALLQTNINLGLEDLMLVAGIYKIELE